MENKKPICSDFPSMNDNSAEMLQSNNITSSKLDNDEKSSNTMIKSIMYQNRINDQLKQAKEMKQEPYIETQKHLEHISKRIYDMQNNLFVRPVQKSNNSENSLDLEETTNYGMKATDNNTKNSSLFGQTNQTQSVHSVSKNDYCDPFTNVMSSNETCLPNSSLTESTNTKVIMNEYLNVNMQNKCNNMSNVMNQFNGIVTTRNSTQNYYSDTENSFNAQSVYRDNSHRNDRMLQQSPMSIKSNNYKQKNTELYYKTMKDHRNKFTTNLVDIKSAINMVQAASSYIGQQTILDEKNIELVEPSTGIESLMNSNHDRIYTKHSFDFAHDCENYNYNQKKLDMNIIADINAIKIEHSIINKKLMQIADTTELLVEKVVPLLDGLTEVNESMDAISLLKTGFTKLAQSFNNIVLKINTIEVNIAEKLSTKNEVIKQNIIMNKLQADIAELVNTQKNVIPYILQEINEVKKSMITQRIQDSNCAETINDNTSNDNYST